MHRFHYAYHGAMLIAGHDKKKYDNQEEHFCRRASSRGDHLKIQDTISTVRLTLAVEDCSTSCLPQHLSCCGFSRCHPLALAAKTAQKCVAQQYCHCLLCSAARTVRVEDQHRPHRCRWLKIRAKLAGVRRSVGRKIWVKAMWPPC